ncbi:MAG: ABC transporter permease [Propionibacteriaceae bacterium]|jgi:ABC-2 type transport system permease protein|nr:ABC transporter permease [Propionibacteriaceae bacterium]
MSHGLNLAYTGLEVRRTLKKAVTLFFCFAMPIGFYLAFGAAFGDQPAGTGNVDAVILALMGLYGSCMTTTTAAIGVAMERPLGWNRQLRLTPLRPWAYVATKLVAGLVAAFCAVLVLYVVGVIRHAAEMPGAVWALTFVLAWLGGLTFSGIGLFIAMLCRGDTATAVAVPVLMICAVLSGCFQLPLSGAFFDTAQRIVPMGGPVRLIMARFGPDALVADGWDWANTIGWIVLGLAAAIWAFARDTQRQ